MIWYFSKEASVLDVFVTNTFNTFNTFWNSIVRKGDYKDNLNSNLITINEWNLKTSDEIGNNNTENDSSNLSNSIRNKNVGSPKMLKVLKVLENQKQPN